MERKVGIEPTAYNAMEPMTVTELQQWLGHRSPHSTQYHAELTPTTLARAYADAGYFTRNLRTIEVPRAEDGPTGEPNWGDQNAAIGSDVLDKTDEAIDVRHTDLAGVAL